MNKPNCCGACLKEIGSTAFSRIMGCANAACTCHTAQTTPSEEWERKFDERFPLIRFNPEWNESIRPLVDEENERRKEERDFIREIRTAAYQEGVRDALEIVEENKLDVLNRELHNKQLGISNTNRRISRWKAEAANKVLEKVKEVIIARLLDT